MVKPEGTGSPARVISAQPAPLPPSSERMVAEPSSNRYTHLVAVVSLAIPCSSRRCLTGNLRFDAGDEPFSQVIDLDAVLGHLVAVTHGHRAILQTLEVGR